METTSFPSQHKIGKFKIKEILHKDAVTFIDAGVKPDMVKHHILRNALASEYSRRLRLDILAYPQRRTKRYIGHKNLLDLSWRQLEKIRDRLKKGTRTTKKVQRRRRRHRKSRRSEGEKLLDRSLLLINELVHSRMKGRKSCTHACPFTFDNRNNMSHTINLLFFTHIKIIYTQQ